MCTSCNNSNQNHAALLNPYTAYSMNLVQGLNILRFTPFLGDELSVEVSSKMVKGVVTALFSSSKKQR